mmetsp:Transcript_18485/g.45971  ORF Transcript_18485/g.45971 Transcript_18485/m.45971 type:complete len:281 (+) Transcript_18485:154-996(+)
MRMHRRRRPTHRVSQPGRLARHHQERHRVQRVHPGHGRRRAERAERQRPHVQGARGRAAVRQQGRPVPQPQRDVPVLRPALLPPRGRRGLQGRGPGRGAGGRPHGGHAVRRVFPRGPRQRVPLQEGAERQGPEEVPQGGEGRLLLPDVLRRPAHLGLHRQDREDPQAGAAGDAVLPVHARALRHRVQQRPRDRDQREHRPAAHRGHHGGGLRERGVQLLGEVEGDAHPVRPPHGEVQPVLVPAPAPGDPLVQHHQQLRHRAVAHGVLGHYPDARAEERLH